MSNKLWIPLIFVTLLLQACGTEKTNEIVQNQNYNYVEIEECTIPIAKKYEKLDPGTGYLYRFSYHSTSVKDFINSGLIHVRHIKEGNHYIDRREWMAQQNTIHINSETKRKHFKIIEYKIVDGVLKPSYSLYGKKTNIDISNAKKEDVNYLLNYCEKTWKLNKGEQ